MREVGKNERRPPFFRFALGVKRKGEDERDPSLCGRGVYSREKGKLRL